MKKYTFLFLFFFIVINGNAQVTTIYSQGKNYTGSSSYVPPVVTRTYGSYSSGYHPQERTSYNVYTFKPGPNTITNKANNNGKMYNDEPLQKIADLPKGLITKGTNGKYGISEVTGKVLVTPQYDEVLAISQFDEGMDYYRVKLGNKYGVVWPYNSEKIIPIEYDEIKPTSSFTAIVFLEKKVGVFVWGVFYDKPKLAIPVIYDEIGPFNGYGFWVRKGNKYGAISEFNNVMIPIEYDGITEYGGRGFLVIKENKMGIVNASHKKMLPIKYDNISTVTNGVAWMHINNKWGLLNESAEIIAEPIYDSIYEQAYDKVWVNDLAVVSKNGTKFYLNMLGKELAFNDETKAAAENRAKNLFIENFQEGNNKYKWDLTSGKNIAAGYFTFTPLNKNSGYEYGNFPKEFSFNKNDDWSFEVSIEKAHGNQFITSFGITFGGKNSDLNQIVIGNYSAYITGGKSLGSVDVKHKKGMNNLKLIKTGSTIEVYYNNKLIGSKWYGDFQDGSFRFLASSPGSTNNLVLINFDDIKFEILKRG